MMRLIIGKLRNMMRKILALLANPGVIRHRLKIQATITNAQVFQEVQAEFGL